jgi:hypothetical protein
MVDARCVLEQHGVSCEQVRLGPTPSAECPFAPQPKISAANCSPNFGY